MSEREDAGNTEALQARFPWRVKDERLLLKALQHPSYVNENDQACALGDNERLEFLGDAVLDLVVADHLYCCYGEFSVGQLTQLRARLVNTDSLHRIAQSLDLGPFMLLGKGESQSISGRRRRGLLADGLEAIIGAVYLDAGFESAYRFVLILMEEQIRQAARETDFRDYKSLLQQTYAQKNGDLPSYKVVEIFGPQHRRGYKVEVWIQGEWMGTGLALSKKKAQQLAARHAFSRWSRESEA